MTLGDVLPGDLLRVGAVGLRTRRLRAALSALGIAIGIASMVAVLGISESSRADLLAQLDRLGTNLLRVAPGQSFSATTPTLPESAGAMLRRVDGVQRVDRCDALDAAPCAARPDRPGGDRRHRGRRRRPGAAGDARGGSTPRALPERRDGALPGGRARRDGRARARHRPRRRARGLDRRALVHRGRHPRPR